MIYDIASSSLASTVKAHDGAVWAIHLRPDGQALVTGSADKTVKFWELKTTIDRETRVRRSYDPCLLATLLMPIQSSTVDVEHTSSLQMPDDVLAVKYSPNGKLIAVSLLDSTVKIFYQDTLKFFLSLYGHKVRTPERRGERKC